MSKIFKIFRAHCGFTSFSTVTERMIALISVVIMLGLVFAVFTYKEISDIAADGAQLNLKEKVQFEKITAIRDLLFRLKVGKRALDPVVLEDIRARARVLSEWNYAGEAVQSITKLVGEVERVGVGAPVDRRLHDEAMASVGALIELKELDSFRSAEKLRTGHGRAVYFAVIVLCVFLLIVFFGSIHLAKVITQPMLAFSGFINEINEKDELVLSGKKINAATSDYKEILGYFREYRTRSLGRLLVEKRRADIVAASVSDGLFLLRGHEVLFVNSVGERILGLPAEFGWQGLNLKEAANDERLGVARDGVRVVMDAISRTMPIEHSVFTENGNRFHFLLQGYQIPKELVERVEHLIDSESLKQMERWQADTIVVARDVTVVRESQEAKNHFIATLSHEIKTPVTSLTMAVRLLNRHVEKFPEPTQRSLVRTCVEDVDRLRKLLEDLLSVSSFDSLAQCFDFKVINLAKLLKQSVQFFQPQAFERGIELVTNGLLAGKPVLACVDATKISWALSNLVTNALRHSPRGGKILIGLEVEGSEARIRVRDSGPGVERERKNRIFERYNPYYDLRVGRSGAAGMGLAIAREIVLAHGGRISVTSEPGLGAEFLVVLPLDNSPGKKEINSGTHCSR